MPQMPQSHGGSPGVETPWVFDKSGSCSKIRNFLLVLRKSLQHHLVFGTFMLKLRNVCPGQAKSEQKCYHPAPLLGHVCNLPIWEYWGYITCLEWGNSMRKCLQWVLGSQFFTFQVAVYQIFEDEQCPISCSQIHIRFQRLGAIQTRKGEK